MALATTLPTSFLALLERIGNYHPEFRDEIEAELDAETVKTGGRCATCDLRCATCYLDERDRLAAVSPICCHCDQPLTGIHYGAGDGRGQKFACEACYILGQQATV